MSRLACALVVGLALVTAGCAGAHKRSSPRAIRTVSPLISVSQTVHGPFVGGGGFASGPGSGLWGDTYLGADGDHIGCVPGRHYADAVSLENASTEPVTLIAARALPDRAPRIISRVAMQISSAPPRADSRLADIILRHWSAAPARPVRIRAGWRAIVQSNFRMAHCKDLAGGRTLVVPGRLFLRYRAGGKAGRERIAETPIFLTQGPTKQPCAHVLGGSSGIVASNIRCGVARRAAVACHPLAHGSWGTCMSAGKLWDCGRTAERRGWAVTERCWLPRNKSRWFRVSWKHDA